MFHVDLNSYFQRVGYRGHTAVTLPVLVSLVRSHTMSVPFENIDVQLGIPLTTSVDDAFEKIVTRRRGGWCYEQNGLFGAVLTQLGFQVTRIAAHVMRSERGPVTDNSHLSLLVSLPGTISEEYLVDVGFGGSLLAPLPLCEGEWEHEPFRLGLRKINTETWQFYEEDNGDGEFSFDFRSESGDEEALSAKCLDLQQNPESNFVRTLVVQKRRDDARLSLRGRVLKTESLGSSHSETVDSMDQFHELLDMEFGLDMADVTELWERVMASHELFIRGSS